MAITSSQAAIVCRDITKEFGAGAAQVRALRGVDIEVHSGELTLLVGPSGCGKSTLLSVIAGILEPTAGSVTVLGTDLGRLSPRRKVRFRGEHVGFVFQQFNLLPRTSAIENVELPLLYTNEILRDPHARALQALESVGLAGRADHHPNQLSGGQQQRVAIARALVNNPQIILADEPTGALDSRTSIEIMAIFQRLNREQGITTILVTHEPDIATYANRNIYFRDGKIVRDEKIANPHHADRELLASGVA